MKKTWSSNFQDNYEISLSLELVHFKQTKEIELVNLDTGEEFLMAEDYEQAMEIFKLLRDILTPPVEFIPEGKLPD